MDILRPVLDQVAKLWGRVDMMPVVRWATVTQTGPLRIRMDGDVEPMALTPMTVVAALRVGDRVLCVEQHRRVIIFGKAQRSNVLWEGSPLFMQDGQTITLAQKVSEQRTGIVLVWSNFTGGSAVNASIQYTFIPREHVSLFPGAGVNVVLSNAVNPPTPITKYVYVNDTTIVGDAINNDAPADTRVLRAVLGV